MQKPDANGFINVTWPSESIPHGGIFHTRVVEHSAEQDKFLKILLEESKLSIAQRQKSALELRQASESKVKRQPEERVQYVRPHTSRRRSLSAIRESGVLTLDTYRPIKRGEDREKLKERLANLMTYGDNGQQQEISPINKKITKPARKLPTNKERWNDLLTQIREREEWLAEMEYLGEAGPHRDIIQDQIAERMRALDALAIDSPCSSARSSATGFSTLRSREKIQGNRRLSDQGLKIGHSSQSQDKQNSAHSSLKQKSASSVRSHKMMEENVSAYGQLTPLQFSPRR